MDRALLELKIARTGFSGSAFGLAQFRTKHSDQVGLRKPFRATVGFIDHQNASLIKPSQSKADTGNRRDDSMSIL